MPPRFQPRHVPTECAYDRQTVLLCSRTRSRVRHWTFICDVFQLTQRLNQVSGANGVRTKKRSVGLDHLPSAGVLDGSRPNAQEIFEFFDIFQKSL